MNLADMNEGSFRGVPFLIKSATTTGGRKQVKHEYPNSPKQKIQDLGFMPRNFKISAVIAPVISPSGAVTTSYRNARNALLDALEQGGNGTLSHPYFDSSIEVTARPYTLNEDTKNAGYSTIELEFDYSALKSVPRAALTSKSQIYQAKQSLLDKIELSFIDNLVTTAAQSYQAVLSTLTEFTDSILSTVQSWQVDLGYGEFLGSVNAFSNEMSSLIRTPETLANSLFGVTSGISGLYENQFAALNVLAQLFSFGDDSQDLPETTYQRRQANKSRKLIKDTVQIAALAECYNSAAEADYESVSQIETTQAIMEAQYQAVLAFDNYDVIYALSNMRALTNAYLEQAKLSTGRIIAVDTFELPSSVIAFNYYGYDDNLDEKADLIVTLNRPESNDTAFISGTIDLVTA